MEEYKNNTPRIILNENLHFQWKQNYYDPQTWTTAVVECAVGWWALAVQNQPTSTHYTL